jgi:hypothetical protein
LKTGDTFYFNHALAHHHLWVVAGGPSPAGEFAIFNVTTVCDGCDRTCLLDVGDHQTISHLSYVTYLHGRAFPASIATAQAHLFAWRESLDPAVLLRIQQGALASPHASSKLQGIVRNHP